MARAESSSNSESDCVTDALRALVRLLARQAAAEVHASQTGDLEKVATPTEGDGN
jgi:hypothetical protein